MLEIANVVERFGLKADGRLEPFETLVKGTFPVIAHVDGNHYVVVEQVDVRGVAVAEHDGRRSIWPTSRFRARWEGKLLRVTRAGSYLPAHDCRGDGSVSPQISFDALVRDEGQIPTGATTVQYVFPFRNLGKEDLIIEKVEASCQCLSVAKPEHPVVPGATAEIVAEYRSDGSGSFEQTLDVYSNDPCFPIITLAAAGNTSTLMQVHPRPLDLGTLVAGHATTGYILVTYFGDTPLRVVRASCDLPQVRLQSERLTAEHALRLNQQNVRLPGLANSWIVSATLSVDYSVDADLEGVLLITTDTDGYERIEVPIRAKVIAPAFCKPSLILFDVIDPNSVVRRRLMIHAHGSQPVRVVGVLADIPTFRLDSKPKGYLINTEIEFACEGRHALEAVGREIEIQLETRQARHTFSLFVPVHGLLRVGPSSGE